MANMYYRSSPVVCTIITYNWNGIILAVTKNKIIREPRFSDCVLLILLFVYLKCLIHKWHTLCPTCFFMSYTSPVWFEELACDLSTDNRGMSRRLYTWIFVFVIFAVHGHLWYNIWSIKHVSMVCIKGKAFWWKCILKGCQTEINLGCFLCRWLWLNIFQISRWPHRPFWISPTINVWKIMRSGSFF